MMGGLTHVASDCLLSLTVEMDQSMNLGMTHVIALAVAEIGENVTPMPITAHVGAVASVAWVAVASLAERFVTL